ncbi:MAG: hypothetical protein RLN88_11855 [Ekhidna sp.]|uniref:hypothetical protein n=1 Tax=Ekhidna sp. TaxID=2608089 RepID=UPI0032EB7A9D
MDDFSFWWYIIAAVIYFLTRSKKKQQPNTRPGSENNPPPSQPKSFEDLLREITEGRSDEDKPVFKQEPVRIDREEREKEDIRLEGERRAFADDESRRVYEESIKMAEGADLVFEPDEAFQEPRLFKAPKADQEDKWTLADEIRDGLNSSEAKKAVIYSEILSRKY